MDCEGYTTDKHICMVRIFRCQFYIVNLYKLKFGTKPQYWPTEDLQEIYSLWYDGKYTEVERLKYKNSLENTERTKFEQTCPMSIF